MPGSPHPGTSLDGEAPQSHPPGGNGQDVPALARRAQAGVTLIELLVAGLIVSLAIVGIAIMFGQAQTYLSAEVDDRIGVGLAQQKIEALRALGFDCIPVGDGDDPAFGLHAVLPLGPATSTDPTCDDTPGPQGTQAARKYNEDSDDHQAPDDPERRMFDPARASYARRLTRVECIDPATFDLQAPQSPCAAPPLAKKITVEVIPRSDAARAIRVEALVAIH
jgi:hypothetical protein